MLGCNLSSQHPSPCPKRGTSQLDPRNWRNSIPTPATWLRNEYLEPNHEQRYLLSDPRKRKQLSLKKGWHQAAANACRAKRSGTPYVANTTCPSEFGLSMFVRRFMPLPMPLTLLQQGLDSTIIPPMLFHVLTSSVMSHHL